MKRFLLLASLAAVAVGGVAAVPAEAGAATAKCKLVGKRTVKCPRGKLRGPRGPRGPQGPAGPLVHGDPTGTGAAFVGAFSLRGDAVIPGTNLFAGDSFEFDATCPAPGNPEPSLESGADFTQIGQTATGANVNNIAGSGDEDNLDPDADDDVVNILVIRPASGNNSVVIYTLDGPEAGDDCRIDGVGVSGTASAPVS